MQKQFKQIDEQLQINHFIRLPDPIPKPANSFFRALSISIFSNHHETQYIKSIMKLTLQANCQAYLENIVLKKKKKRHIAFPIISQSSQLVKKYVNDKQMLQTYFQSPDLDCFQNDNYQLASFTFNRRVSVFYLNKDNYLNETLISCCRNKRGKKIILAKIGRRYFAVQKQATRSMSVFIREYLLGNLISNIVVSERSQNSNKVHFMGGYDEIKLNSHKKFPKTHKKSLSQCGDINIMSKLEQFRDGFTHEEMDGSFHNHTNMIKNNYDSVENRSHQEKNLLDRDLDFCDREDRVGGCEGNSGVVMGKEQRRERESEGVAKQQVIAIEDEAKIEQIQKQQQYNKVQNYVSTEQQSKHNIMSQQQQLPLPFDNNRKTIQTTTPSSEGIDSITTNNQSYSYGLSYIEDPQQQQQVQEPSIQMQNQYNGYYQQQQYVYSNYQYYQQQYSTYYNMNMHQMMYDPQQYYQYYQTQQPQQPQPYQYSQPQPYQYSQPQQLIQNNRYQGRLKFYDSNGKYGFIIVDNIGSDLFVHYDDLSKAGITKQQLQTHSASRQLRFQFTYYEYQGKNKKAKKAIDLLLLTEI